MKKSIVLGILSALLLIFPAVNVLQAQNEISLSINAMPPYSPNISDYTDNPGKIMINLVNTTNVNQIIYLQISLSGDDNGIMVMANQNNTTGMQLDVQPNQVMQITYLTLQQFFNGSALTYDGITEQEILNMNGVPEGNYTLCVQAFSFANPGTPLSSGESCTHFFIQSIQPPMLILPENEAQISIQGIQNIIFSWTIPPGTSPGTMYRLTLIEMLDTNRPKEDYFNSGQIPPLFETTLLGNVFLYGPAQPSLVTGRKYAWAVTATSSFTSPAATGTSGAAFINNGRSEIRDFRCTSGTTINPAYSLLDFIVPGSNVDTLRVSDTSDLFLNAAWLNMEPFTKGKGKHYLSSLALKQMNIHDYHWEIVPANDLIQSGNSFVRITKQPPYLNSPDSLLPLIGLNFSRYQCDSMKFVDGKKYLVKLIASDDLGNEIAQTSRTFFYRRGNVVQDNIVKVKGSLKYHFDGYANAFPVAGTVVKLVLINEAKGNEITAQLDYKPANETAYYATTDKDGLFTVNVIRPSSHQKPAFKFLVESQYYQQTDKKITLEKIGTEQSIGQIELDVYSYSLKLNVYKVFSNEYKPVINNEQTGAGGGFHFQQTTTIDSTIKEAVKEGIPVYIYRKNKASNLPVIEGDQTTAPATGNGYIKVAMAKTQKEIVGGKTNTFVQFKKLVCNLQDFPDDTYYIFAGDDPTKQTGGGGGNGLQFQFHGNLYKAYEDSSFTAEEMPLRFSRKNFSFHAGKDTANYSTTRNYTLVSTDPPKSKIKGKLIYAWPSDANGVLRPLANMPFKVQVEYVINGMPVPTYSVSNMNAQFTQGSSAGFEMEVDGQSSYLETPDSRMVVASGTTDNDGNFEVDVININQKGPIGYGSYHVTHSSSTHLLTDDPFSDLEKILEDLKGGIDNPNDGNHGFGDPDYGVQGAFGQNGILNFADGMGIVNLGTTLGTTQIFGAGPSIKGGMKGGLHGPGQGDESWPEEPGETPPGSTYSDSVVATGYISRVYRIQLDGNASSFYYNPELNIVCNAFESVNLASPVKAFVREMELEGKITKISKENSAPPGGGIKTVVFRDPALKIPGLPAGEGDEKYRKKKLLWPDFGIPSGVEFTREVEWLSDTTSASQTGNTGTQAPPDIVRIRKLIMPFNHYSIEACSDPSQTNQYYMPKIQDIGTMNNIGYGAYFDTRLVKNGLPVNKVSINLEPLPSRIGARVKNNETDKPMGNVNVTVAIKTILWDIVLGAGLTDKDGYVEFKGLITGNGKAYKMYAKYPGYSQLSVVTTQPMDKFGAQYIQNPLLMEPDAVLLGKIVNESKQGVESYLIRKDSSYVKSDGAGNFKIPMPSGKDTLYIVPLDVGYFRDTLVITLPKGNTQSPDLTVYRRKHRMNFIVVDDANPNTKITGAKLWMNNMLEKSTNNQGEAYFEFENISYQNFTVKVSGPKNSDYIAQLINLANKESEKPQSYLVKLKKGGAISGIVTLNGSPASGARVYLVQQQQTNTNNIGSLNNTANLQVQDYNNQNLNLYQGGNNAWQQIPIGGTVDNNTATGYEVLQQGTLPLIEAYTDKSGKYTLHGIPALSGVMTFNATLDTTFTVIGDTKQSAIQAGQTSPLDFALTKYDYMTIASVFGFPLKIEKLSPTNDINVVKVSGVIDLRYSASSFVFTQGNQMARVNDVTFTGKMVNGKRIGYAANQDITIEGMANLKFRYTEKYNVKLTEELASNEFWAQQQLPNELKLRKGSNGKGYIEGFAQITDNSFNYPSSYLKFNNNQDFYLCNIENGKINNQIRAISASFTEDEAVTAMASNNPSQSAGQWNIAAGNNLAPAISGSLLAGSMSATTPGTVMTVHNNLNLGGASQVITGLNTSLATFGPFTYVSDKEYNLCNSSKDSLRMKLIMFNAAADPLKSFVSKDGKIHLNVLMQCYIPNAKPARFKVEIPEMILDNNSITPGGSDKPLKLALEKWTLEVNNWTLSPVKGGFYSENAVVRTGQLDVPSKLFNLRNDMVVIGEFQTTSINLGNGLIYLKEIDNKRVKLNYDYKTGSDMSGHWLLSVSGEAGKPAARIYGMADHLQEDVLELEYVQLLSNGENILSLKQGKTYKVKRNPMATYTPTGIASFGNEFALYGGVKLNAPRIQPFALTMNFKKGNGSSLVSEVQPVNMSFEGKGFVTYQSSSTLTPKFSKDSIIIVGTVREEGALPAINSTFYGYAQGERYEIILKKNDIFNLFEKGSTGDYRFQVDSGGMFVNKQLNDWSFLTFAGKALPKSAADNIKENRMKFTVYGEIQADGNSISAGDLSAFPGFKLVYKLPTKELIGTMHLQNIEMGAVSLTSMDAEMLMSPNGWYLAAFGEIMVPPFPIASFKAGIIVGNYPQFTASLKSMLVQYSPTADPCAFKSGISGFYVMAGKPIINKSIGYGFGPMAGSLNINIGLEADFLMNFSEGKLKLKTGAGLYGIAKAELTSITCTTIAGEVEVKGRVNGEINDGKVELNGSISTGFAVKIEQGIPFFDGCEANTTLFSACCGSSIVVSSANGFSFSLSGDCSTPECK